MRQAVMDRDNGLSPRGRGNLRPRDYEMGGMGSIPAWAGEPASSPPSRGTSGVYPRVGGGTAGLAASNDAGQGLSPRGRGNRGRLGYLREPDGSIPAWAGEPALP